MWPQPTRFPHLRPHSPPLSRPLLTFTRVFYRLPSTFDGYNPSLWWLQFGVLRTSCLPGLPLVIAGGCGSDLPPLLLYWPPLLLLLLLLSTTTTGSPLLLSYRSLDVPIRGLLLPLPIGSTCLGEHLAWWPLSPAALLVARLSPTSPLLSPLLRSFPPLPHPPPPDTCYLVLTFNRLHRRHIPRHHSNHTIPTTRTRLVHTPHTFIHTLTARPPPAAHFTPTISAPPSSLLGTLQPWRRWTRRRGV